MNETMVYCLMQLKLFFDLELFSPNVNLAAYQAAGDYSDATTKAKEAQYQKGERLLAEQAFASAVGYQDALKRSYQICYQDLSEGKIAAGSGHIVGLKSDGTIVATGMKGE